MITDSAFPHSSHAMWCKSVSDLSEVCESGNMLNLEDGK